LKLDDKVNAINRCDGGKSCLAVAEEMGVGCTQIMNILWKKPWDSQRFWKQCFQFNIVLLEIVLLFIKYLYLFISSPGHFCLLNIFIYLLVHLDQRSRWTIAISWHLSSVNFSHFKLILRNHWANWNQT
jgi:hypothetical protein